MEGGAVKPTKNAFLDESVSHDQGQNVCLHNY